MSNPTTDHQHEDASRDVIVLIDDETLTQDCLAEAMRSAFPQAIILGAPTIDKLPRPNGTPIAMVVLKAKALPSTLNGIASDIRAVTRHFPKVPVVVITSCDTGFNIETAIASGAQGVIPVTASLKIAVAALQLVLAGGTYYPHPIIDSARMDIALRDTIRHAAELPTYVRAAERLPDPVHPFVDSVDLDAKEPGGLMATFTAREADVLAALQCGRSNKWIAHHLNLSENTVKVHIRHIMRKLHATNRTEAVILSQHRMPYITGR
jgi:DNA-binding NarL/FixJ family response regulator